MEIQEKETIRIFHALSDTNRYRIFRMLSGGELCACKILEKFDITQPTLSHHMKVLTECGLVTGRKDGIWMHYAINPDILSALIGILTDVLNSPQEPSETRVCRGV